MVNRTHHYIGKCKALPQKEGLQLEMTLGMTLNTVAEEAVCDWGGGGLKACTLPKVAHSGAKATLAPLFHRPCLNNIVHTLHIQPPPDNCR